MKPEDRAALEAWKISTPEIKYKFENRSLLHEMIADEAWQAALAHRDAQPAVAVNQRMRTALQEIANTVNYAQWYQETAEKALEDANHTEVALDKVAAVAVNEQLLRAAKKYFVNYCLDEASEFFAEDTGCRQEQHDDAVELREAIAAAEAAKGGV